MRTVAVIGGGASGMMAAVTAATEGARVIILEHKDRIGKKILSTGNGRCNFTNTHQEPLCYHSEDPLFPWGIIETQKTGTDISIPIPTRRPQCLTRSGWNWSVCMWRSGQELISGRSFPGKSALRSAQIVKISARTV